MNLIFPKHIALTLTHNDHKVSYETVEEYLTTQGSLASFSHDSWVSLDEKQKAIDTDEMWELAWNPNTPVGSCTMRASTLEALMEWVQAYNMVEVQFRQ